MCFGLKRYAASGCRQIFSRSNGVLKANNVHTSVKPYTELVVTFRASWRPSSTARLMADKTVHIKTMLTCETVH